MVDSLGVSITKAVQYIRTLTFRDDFQLYKLFRMADQAPIVAKEYFGNPANLDDLTVRLDRLVVKTRDPDERATLAGGNMYAVINYYRSTGDVHRFVSALRNLEQNQQNPHHVLAKGLGWLGTSLFELCLESRQLLTPDQLDYLLFQRFAPASATANKDYREKPALFVVTLLPFERYRVLFFSSKFSCDEQDLGQLLEGAYRIGGYGLCGSRDLVAKQIAGIAQKQEIQEYGIVEVATPHFEGYLFLRWAIEQAGRWAEQHKIQVPVGFRTIKLPSTEATRLN